MLFFKGYQVIRLEKEGGEKEYIRGYGGRIRRVKRARKVQNEKKELFVIVFNLQNLKVNKLVSCF